jgi:hypothetical protein
VSPPWRPTAGVTALPCGASSARTQNTRRSCASAPTWAFTARGPADLARACHGLDGRRDLRRDHLDVRARREQPGEAALGDDPAAHHDDAAACQVEPDEIGIHVRHHPAITCPCP